MKSASAQQKIHIAGSRTTMSTCFLLVRADGVSMRFTDNDQSLIVTLSAPLNGTYKPGLSYTRTALRSSGDFRVDNGNIMGILNDAGIGELDLLSGLYDSAVLYIFAVNWSDPTQGPIRLKRGTIGQVTKGEISYDAEFRGMNQALKMKLGFPYMPTCPYDFGGGYDAKGIGCGIDLGPLTQIGTVTSVVNRKEFRANGLVGSAPNSIVYTSNGILFRTPDHIYDYNAGFISAGIKALDAILISGSENNDLSHTVRSIASVVIDGHTYDQIITQSQSVVTAVKGPSITVTDLTPGFFDFGKVTWVTGGNAHRKSEVRSWDGTSDIKLRMDLYYDIQVGDTFKITPGCIKTIQRCMFWQRVFDFGGFPFVPGQDAVYTYADA